MKLLVFLPILTSAQFTSKTPFPSLTLPLSDQCFCKLEGQIDDCSCKVDTVDDFNNAKIEWQDKIDRRFVDAKIDLEQTKMLVETAFKPLTIRQKR